MYEIYFYSDKKHGYVYMCTWILRFALVDICGVNLHLDVLRLALMLILATSLNIYWLVEQPEGSKDVLMRHPRMDFFSNCVAWVAW